MVPGSDTVGPCGAKALVDGDSGSDMSAVNGSNRVVDSTVSPDSDGAPALTSPTSTGTCDSAGSTARWRPADGRTLSVSSPPRKRAGAPSTASRLAKYSSSVK